LAPGGIMHAEECPCNEGIDTPGQYSALFVLNNKGHK